MHVSDITYNTSIFINKDSGCENNCPGCKLGQEKADIEKRFNVEEIKKRIDYVEKNMNYGGSFIIQPGNILLKYELKEIFDILNYANNKLNKPIQIEIAKLDERIIYLLENEEIQGLILDKKVFINFGYLDINYELLEKVFLKYLEIIFKGRKKELKKLNLLEEFNKKSHEEKFYYLQELHKKNKIKGEKEAYITGFHNIQKNNPEKTEISKKDLSKLMNKIGFDCKNSDINGNNHYYLQTHGIQISFNIFNNNKTKNGINIWEPRIEDAPECLMMRGIELDIFGNGNIGSHTNPCNEIVLGNIDSTGAEKINSNLLSHLQRVNDILFKHKYKNNFSQEDLCKMCLYGNKLEIKLQDYFYYFIRKTKYDLFNIIKKKN